MKMIYDTHEEKRLLNYLPIITDVLVIIGIFLILSGIFLSLLSIGGHANTEHSSNILSKAGSNVKAKHPEWANTVCNAVAEHKIQAGMNEEQVAQSWGWPYMVNKISANGKIIEEWVMTNKDRSERLYFHNGLLQKVAN